VRAEGGADSPQRLQTEPGPPAFYALAGGGWRDYVTLLHLPYTAWHLAYVAIGAGLAPTLDAGRLVASLAAFGLAVGVAAHCLDELHGRPLRTAIPRAVLRGLAALGLAGAVVLGAVGVAELGPGLIPFIAFGAIAVPAYNLELFGGRLHGDHAFALLWGAFPVLTGYFAQAGTLAPAAFAGAAAAFAFSLAQRRLSNEARGIRRRATGVEGSITWSDGHEELLDTARLLAPHEAALRALAAGHVLVALAIVLSRLA
jgi:hypothetical protein